MRQNLSLSLGITNSTRLSGQQALQGLPCLPSQHQDFNLVCEQLVFTWMVAGLTLVSLNYFPIPKLSFVVINLSFFFLTFLRLRSFIYFIIFSCTFTNVLEKVTIISNILYIVKIRQSKLQQYYSFNYLDKCRCMSQLSHNFRLQPSTEGQQGDSILKLPVTSHPQLRTETNECMHTYCSVHLGPKLREWCPPTFSVSITISTNTTKAVTHTWPTE